MRPFLKTPFIAVLIAPFVLAALPSTTSTAVDGIMITWRQTSTARGVQPTTMQLRVAGNLARIDYQKAPQGMAAGTWMVMDADKGSLTMVSPKDKSATIMPVGGMASVLGAIGAAGLMKAEVSDIAVESQDAGEGEPILGHATHKFTVDQSYRIKVSVMMMKRENTVHSTMEVWVATDIPAAETKVLEDFGRRFLTSMGGMAGFGGDGMRTLQEALADKMPHGPQLRTLTTSVTTDAGGRADTTRSTSEATAYQTGPIDAAVFEIPVGYKIVDMSAGPPGTGPASPSTAKH